MSYYMWLNFSFHILLCFFSFHFFSCSCTPPFHLPSFPYPPFFSLSSVSGHCVFVLVSVTRSTELLYLSSSPKQPLRTTWHKRVVILHLHSRSAWIYMYLFFLCVNYNVLDGLKGMKPLKLHVAPLAIDTNQVYDPSVKSQWAGREEERWGG